MTAGNATEGAADGGPDTARVLITLPFTHRAMAIAVCAIGIGLGLGAIAIARALQANGGLMPSFAAAGFVLFFAVRLVRLMWPGGGRSDLLDVEAADAVTVTDRSLRVFVVLLLTLAYLWLAFVIGFFSATFLYILAAAAFLGVRNWVSILATAGGLVLLMYVFFQHFLGANLPSGVLI